MEVKITKIDGINQNTLEVFFNENDEAYIEGHSVEESAKIIEEFITDSGWWTTSSDKPEKDIKHESPDKDVAIRMNEDDDGSQDKATIRVEENQEVRVDNTTWKGEKYIVNGGVLTVDETTDPEIELWDGRLVYDEISTSELTANQRDTIKNACRSFNSTIAFESCYIDDRIDINDTDIDIVGGGYTEINYGRQTNLLRIASNGNPTLCINDDTHINYLHIGYTSYCYVNSMDRPDDDLVEIDAAIINGRASLNKCYIANLTVENLGEVELCGEVADLHVSGVVEITDKAKVEHVYLHIGGRIYGQVENIDIVSDRPLRIVVEHGVTWICG